MCSVYSVVDQVLQSANSSVVDLIDRFLDPIAENASCPAKRFLANSRAFLDSGEANLTRPSRACFQTSGSWSSRATARKSTLEGCRCCQTASTIKAELPHNSSARFARVITKEP